MLRKLSFIAGTGILAWMSVVAPAGAADIPAAPVVKAPVMVPAAKQSWYGFYIGLHGGYGWGRNSIQFTPDAFYAPLALAGGAPTSLADKPKGFVGGITYGSNYQFDRIVVGTDSDFSYSDIKSSQSFNGNLLGIPFTANASQKLTWFGTSRVRAGVLVSDNILLYGTGGLASGRIEATSNNVVAAPGTCALAGACPFGGITKNLWGWAAGGGVEVASGPWQFRAEYLHYDLGTVNYLARDFVVPAAVIGNSLKVNGDMVRGAITYRFDWTPLGLIFGTDRI